MPDRKVGGHKLPGVSDGVFMSSRDGVHWRRFAVSIPFKVSLVRPQWRASNPLADSFCVELEAAAHVFQQRLAQGLQAEGRA